MSEAEQSIDRDAEASRDPAERFRAALAVEDADAAAADSGTAGPELLPARLARACVAVLPVDGAGLSILTGTFRVPLGSSDEMATAAERLQFTTGEGPCLTSALHARALVTDAEQLLRRYPNFGRDVLASTDYRGVATIPLGFTRHTRGALDLFVIDDSHMEELSLADVSAVGECIVEELTRARTLGHEPDPPDPLDTPEPIGTDVRTGDEPPWMSAPVAVDRERVWIAMGMAMTRFNLPAEEALALLRAHSFGASTDVDRLSYDLVTGAVDLDSLAP